MLSITRLLCPSQCFYILSKREKEYKDEKKEEKKAEVTIVTVEHQSKRGCKQLNLVPESKVPKEAEKVAGSRYSHKHKHKNNHQTQNDKDKVFVRAKKQGTSSEKIKRSDIVRKKGGNSKGDLNEYFVAILKRAPTAKDKIRDGKCKIREQRQTKSLKKQKSETKKGLSEKIRRAFQQIHQYIVNWKPADALAKQHKQHKN
ncbi:hypothetical protein RFI_25559, partial [Reticulomyxa filosa]